MDVDDVRQAVRQFEDGEVSTEELVSLGEEFMIEVFTEAEQGIDIDSDYVTVTAETDELYVSVTHSIKTDAIHGEAYVDPIGIGYIEVIEGEHAIIEDVEFESEPYRDLFPDVQKRREQAAQERRDREAEYRRMVL